MMRTHRHTDVDKDRAHLYPHTDFQLAIRRTTWLCARPLAYEATCTRTSTRTRGGWNTLMSSSSCNNTFLFPSCSTSPVRHSSFHLFLLLLPRPRNVCSACIHAVMSKRYSTYLRDVSRMQMSHQGISIGLRILGWFSRTSGKCPRSPPIYSPLCSDGYRW